MLIPLLIFLGIYLGLAIGGLLGFSVCLSLLGSMANLVVERPLYGLGGSFLEQLRFGALGVCVVFRGGSVWKATRSEPGNACFQTSDVSVNYLTVTSRRS
jgi:hypothetical protein